MHDLWSLQGRGKPPSDEGEEGCSRGTVVHTSAAVPAVPAHAASRTSQMGLKAALSSVSAGAWGRRMVVRLKSPTWAEAGREGSEREGVGTGRRRAAAGLAACPSLSQPRPLALARQLPSTMMLGLLTCGGQGQADGRGRQVMRQAMQARRREYH